VDPEARPRRGRHVEQIDAEIFGDRHALLCRPNRVRVEQHFGVWDFGDRLVHALTSPGLCPLSRSRRGASVSSDISMPIAAMNWLLAAGTPRPASGDRGFRPPRAHAKAELALEGTGTPAMAKLQLSFACGLYDRMQPLYTGEVRAEGID